MRENKLTIQIDKSVTEVFAFTVNPLNTPLWIDSISSEEVNEQPVKRGSVYRNQNKDGNWSEYVVREFRENRNFILDKKDSIYHVQYIFTIINDYTTELEYYEWVDEGNIDDPFLQGTLEKLKNVIENRVVFSKLNKF